MISYYRFLALLFRRITFLRFALLAACTIPGALAADFSYTGTFVQDDDRRSFYFTLASAGSMTVQTSSYAAGGFDPSLSLFDSGGNLIASNRDGGCSNVPANPSNGFCWDAFRSLSLPAGTYTAVLTQSANVANGPSLANGFVYTGQSSFTRGPESTGTTGFWDSTGIARSSSFSLALHGVDSSIEQLVISQLPPPSSGQVGVAYSSQFTASGGTPPYTWNLTSDSGAIPPGLGLSGGGLLSGTPTVFGTYNFTVQATDSNSPAMLATQPFKVQIVPPDLQITTSSLQPGIVNTPFSTTLAATGGYPPYTWSLVPTRSEGPLTLDASGLLMGTPAALGPFSIPVQVTDSQSNTVPLTYTWNAYNALAITTSALPSGIAGMSYGPITLTASGGSGSYSWSSPNLPVGLSLSPAGQLTGSPFSGGTGPVTFLLRDATAVQSASVTLTLAITYQPLTISAGSGSAGAAAGAAYSRTFSASGGKPPYSWSATGLPTGLSLNAATGVLSGTASQPGNFTFSVQVTDSQPVTASTSATLAVIGFTTTSLPNASTVTAYSQSFGAVGGTPPYTFSGQGVPAGLSLSGSGVLSGVAKTAGTYSLNVKVTDSAGVSINSTFSLTVTAPSALTVSAAALSSGTTGTPYSDTLAANGGAPPYTWAIIGGALPDGLSAAASGTVSGTPSKAGTFSFTAQATDTSGGKASGAVSITIAPPPLAAPATSALPNGIAGADYFAQVLAPSGGLPPYAFVVSSGSLPDGLSLSNGQISGTPSATGTFNFTVMATDSATPPASAPVGLGILVKPAHTDLLVSSASLSFSLTAGASGAPGPANVTVESSSVQQVLSYATQVTPAASWLSVSGGGSTPGSITVALDPSAVNLTPSTAPYQTTIAVSCVAPSPCAGSTQTIAVSLTVSAPPAQLTVGNSLLSFAVTGSASQTSSQSFLLQNSGGGTVGIKSAGSADGWLSLSGVPGSLAPGPAVPVTATVNTAGLAPGFYRSSITIASSAGTASLPVTLLISQSASMSLSPSGTQFTAQQGGVPGNPSGSFSVAVAAGATVNWTASVESGAPWLTLATPSGTSTSTSPGQVSFAIDPTAVAALAPQAYYGTIRVTSGGVFNSPQDFEVVLNVAPSSDPAKPDPEPGGLVFISSSAGALPSQTVQVFTSSTAATNFQTSAGTADGANWLSVSPPTGSTSSTSSASTTVTADATGLAPGVYRGGISYSFSSAAVRTVNVTLIVTAAPAAAHAVSAAASASSCGASALVPTQTGLVSNFAQPAAWPTPLTIRLVDNCGTAIANGQVVATFSNGDPPLPLSVTDASSGIYAGTWTPRAASPQVTISARAAAPGFSAATALITGQVSPNQAPVLNPGATLHVFDPLVGGALGPGNIVQIYGSYLAAGTTLAPSVPLPVSLGGTSVVIGGMQAPLYFVSPGQINAQVPFELAPGKKYQVLISANGALTTPDSIQLTDVSPGIAAFSSGQIIAQHLDGSLVNETAPAKPSEIVVFYMAGLGLTNNQVASGAPSPGTVLATPLDAPALTLGGESVPILFGGLTPGLVGLYQVNFQIPNDAPDGDLPLVVLQSGVQSNQTILPVHR